MRAAAKGWGRDVLSVHARELRLFSIPCCLLHTHNEADLPLCAEPCAPRPLSRYGSVAEGAIAYEMNSDFAPVLRDRMHYFNTDPRCGGGWGWSQGMGGGGGVGRL